MNPMQKNLQHRLQAVRRFLRFAHLHEANVPNANGIPRMPVLEAVAKAGKGLIDFKDTAFFSVQHILRTNVPLFKHLIEDFNANPNHIYLSGKGYSDSIEAEALIENLGIQYFKLEKTYDTMGHYQAHLRSHLKHSVWRNFMNHIKKNNIQRIIVIDEGGHSLETMPRSIVFKYPTAGIEQTRGGLYSPIVDSLPFPLVEVASCAIKRHLESPLIVQAIIQKLQKALGARSDINPDTIFGVIGNGAIGSQVTRYLLQRGYTVVAYDENKEAFQGLIHQNLYRVENVDRVLERSDYILGCTGKDILKGTHTLHLLGSAACDQKFISCTSEDKEFYSIIKAMGAHKAIELNNLREIVFTTEAGGKITLVNAGFPVNFDPSGESVPASDIQLTRALMLGACIQAGRHAFKPGSGSEMKLAPRMQLDTALQQFVAREFKKHQPQNRYSEPQWRLSQDISWLKNNSGGREPNDSEFSQTFSASFGKENLGKTKIKFSMVDF